MNNNAYQYGEGNEYLSLDYTRCQRPDGSHYGTGGVCRKGAQVGAKEKEVSKGGSKKPVDSASLGKMSDKQLKELSKRKELDTSQKAAISKEQQDRKNASLNADKSGKSARTAAADPNKTETKKSEEAILKKIEKEPIDTAKEYAGFRAARDAHFAALDKAADKAFRLDEDDTAGGAQARLGLKRETAFTDKTAKQLVAGYNQRNRGDQISLGKLNASTTQSSFQGDREGYKSPLRQFASEEAMRGYNGYK